VASSGRGQCGRCSTPRALQRHRASSETLLQLGAIGAERLLGLGAFRFSQKAASARASRWLRSCKLRPLHLLSGIPTFQCRRTAPSADRGKILAIRWHDQLLPRASVELLNQLAIAKQQASSIFQVDRCNASSFPSRRLPVTTVTHGCLTSSRPKSTPPRSGI
jgi:hypothetical protein